MTKKTPTPLAEIRRAVANLIRAEGCSCCRDTDGYDEAQARLAKLLRVPKFPDGSGYDFRRFVTARRARTGKGT